jgi:predicted nucleotidyltransferase
LDEREKMKLSSSLPDLKILKQVFAKYPDIQAVYIFGSQAEGRMREESDLDLAILPKSGETHKFCRVDVVFLDTDDIVLKYEAIRQNKLIYQSGDFRKGTYHSLVLRQYFDFYPYLKVQREALKRRILSG